MQYGFTVDRKSITRRSDLDRRLTSVRPPSVRFTNALVVGPVPRAGLRKSRRTEYSAMKSVIEYVR